MPRKNCPQRFHLNSIFVVTFFFALFISPTYLGLRISWAVCKAVFTSKIMSPTKPWTTSSVLFVLAAFSSFSIASLLSFFSSVFFGAPFSDFCSLLLSEPSPRNIERIFCRCPWCSRTPGWHAILRIYQTLPITFLQ